MMPRKHATLYGLKVIDVTSRCQGRGDVDGESKRHCFERIAAQH